MHYWLCLNDVHDQVKRFPNLKNKNTALKIYLHLPVVLEGLFTECKGLFTPSETGNESENDQRTNTHIQT